MPNKVEPLNIRNARCLDIYGNELHPRATVVFNNGNHLEMGEVESLRPVKKRYRYVQPFILRWELKVRGLSDLNRLVTVKDSKSVILIKGRFGEDA